MTGPAATYGALFLAGLVGSVHCLGMCGPLLLAFSRALGDEPAGPGEAKPSSRWRRSAALVWYHAGRLWTYAMLGLLAGWAAGGLRRAAVDLGWQRPVGAALALAVVGVAVVGLGWLPRVRLDLLPAGCLAGGRWPAVQALLRHPRPVSRLVVGAAMGLLPCGLVYAAVLLSASLPSPAASALGMLCFGLGTLPALSALLVAVAALPARWRVGSPRFAAALLLVAGLVMLVRAVTVHAH